jgi:acyl carrier protein
MTTEIKSKLATFITTEIFRQPGRTLAPDEPLLSSGLVDSFSVVELSLFVEEAFGVVLDDAELTRNVIDTLYQLEVRIGQEMEK